jgi:hypothetical protein
MRNGTTVTYVGIVGIMEIEGDLVVVYRALAGCNITDKESELIAEQLTAALKRSHVRATESSLSKTEDRKSRRAVPRGSLFNDD